MSGYQYDGFACKTLLHGIEKSISKKKTYRSKTLSREKTRKSPKWSLSISKNVHKPRSRRGSLESHCDRITEARRLSQRKRVQTPPSDRLRKLEIPSRRKRRFSSKRPKPSKTVQARGSNVDSLIENEAKKPEISPLTSRVISFQEISSGRAAVSKLSTSSVRFDYNRGTPTESPPIDLPKSSSGKKTKRDKREIIGTPTSFKTDDCRTPLSFREGDDDFFLESFNIELPIKIENEKPRINREPSWTKERRNSMGSGLGTYVSCFSDWNDEFIGWDEEDSDQSPELTIASRNSWGSDPTSPMERSLSFDDQRTASDCGHRISSQMLEEGPPLGMLLVALINSRSGNRFQNFPLACPLHDVTAWLGENLPVVIEGEGLNRRTRCKPSLSLSECFGKILDNPAKQGLACFVGPVNGKVCWVIKVCELSRLHGLRVSTKEYSPANTAKLVLEHWWVNEDERLIEKPKVKKTIIEEKEKNRDYGKENEASPPVMQLKKNCKKDFKIMTLEETEVENKLQGPEAPVLKQQNETWRSSEQINDKDTKMKSKIETSNTRVAPSETEFSQSWNEIADLEEMLRDMQITDSKWEENIYDIRQTRARQSEVDEFSMEQALNHIETSAIKSRVGKWSEGLKPCDPNSLDQQVDETIKTNMLPDAKSFDDELLSAKKLIVDLSDTSSEYNVTSVLDQRVEANELTYYKHKKPLEDYSNKYTIDRLTATVLDRRQKCDDVTYYTHDKSLGDLP